MKIWLVEHPISQYKEDVKALASKAGLKIIDSKFKGMIAGEVETNPPELTSKSKRQVNKEAKEAQAALLPKIENTESDLSV